MQTGMRRHHFLAMPYLSIEVRLGHPLDLYVATAPLQKGAELLRTVASHSKAVDILDGSLRDARATMQAQSLAHLSKHLAGS